MSDFVEQYNAMEEALGQLDVVRELFFNAMHEGIINPTTCTRTMAGIDRLRLDFINKNNNVDEFYYKVSLENLDEILSLAKVVDFETSNMPVCVWIDKEVEIVKSFLKAFFNSSQKELTQQSVDKLLLAIQKLDNYIDE